MLILLSAMMLISRVEGATNDLLSLELEDLSQVAVMNTAATLTATDTRHTPASMVRITREDILRSGARTLDELLDIYVPGLAYMYKLEGTQLGIRGIISDRNNKILLTVNGRNMSVKTRDGGAITERWFSTLGDIRSVTVISSPGSAVYGPGAIAGVIDIETFDSNSFEGTDFSLRGGAGEEFLSGEMRYGHKFDENTGLFFYYGMDDYSGADDAPHKLAFDMVNQPWPGGNNILIEANEDFPFRTTADNGAFEDMLRHKLHLQLDGENYSLWARYTRSGLAIPTSQHQFRYLNLENLQHTGTANQQLTLFGSYTQEISEKTRLEYSLSYLLSDVLISRYGRNSIRGGLRNWREDNATLNITAHHSPSAEQNIALGMEFIYNRFGRQGWLYEEYDDTLKTPPGSPGVPDPLEDGTEWHSNMLSFFGEYQWLMNEQWTAFAGIRLDKHRYTPWMFSPRLALIYSPDINQSYKLSYDHSVRHADDLDLYLQNQLESGKGDVEKIDHLEFIYTKTLYQKLQFDLSTYFNHHQVVSFNPEKFITEYLGTLDTFGMEAQLSYHQDRFDLYFSHAFTKQLDFDLEDPQLEEQNISASVYGYGNDLANWNNHISKLRFDYRFSNRLTWNNSLRIYWGMPGAVDMADYNRNRELPYSWERFRLPLYEDSKRAFEESLFLNTGLDYRAGRNLSIHLNAYNLLGLFDEDYNKRNYFLRTSHYRDTEPAIALRFTYRLD
ncbi:TonB-dependent receptor plug domain-containing protein [Thiolapillus brandeum]|nr:TonB-dependent receptor plug domain-containing protein [Thiolapillus brandeum]